jgi:Uma2 family endonuclease
MTVAEYERLPNRPGGHWELHHGEPVFVPFPIHAHKVLQRRIRKLLEPICEPRGYVVDSDYAYKPLRQHELWGANVAVVSGLRDEQTIDWLDGSPELIIEVQSNTTAELDDKAVTTLAGEGAVEFWIINPDSATVTAHTKNESDVHAYGHDDVLHLAYFGGASISVFDIFEK